MPLEYEEKRAFPRMHVECPVEIQSLDGGPVVTSTCRDLSGGGILFLSPEELPTGYEYRLVMRGGLDSTPPLKARIRVLRCEVEGDGFEIAARIEEILHD